MACVDAEYGTEVRYGIWERWMEGSSDRLTWLDIKGCTGSGWMERSAVVVEGLVYLLRQGEFWGKPRSSLQGRQQ